ncbi:MAG: amidohydrolase family protein [Acidimicrobiales bacterium]
MGDILVQGGTVVDGSGAPGFTADVRVRDGRIVEIGPGLVPDGEPVVDASGAFVTPGIIDTHTHLDGAMWWNPSLDPLPSYGNTSLVFGNCGNSIAPLAGAQRDEIVDLLCFLEDLPLEAFQREIPWSWEGWPEYARALDGQPTAVHVGGYLGHLSLRTFVMGEAAWERPATAGEIERMCVMLRDGLRAGAAGLSMNHFDKDRRLRPVPGFFADDAEYLALFRVVADHHPATVQVITRFNDRDHDVADAERFGYLCRAAGVRGQWPGMPMNRRDDDHRAALWDVHHRLQDDGCDFWPNVPFKPLAPFFGFERSIVFQRVPAWNEVLNGPAEAKLTTLADPAWRDRARREWDGRTRSSISRIDRPEEMLFTESESGAGPLGVSLADFAAAKGLHISDALAEWVLANGIGSMMVGTPERLSEADVVAALREPRTLANINDSGAHLQLFSGAGEHLYLLTHYVRDEGLLSVEEAVHCLTGRTAAFFGFRDRGVIATGLVGDLAVFALDEIELRGEERRFDVPYGTWRFSRPPAGFRATIVAGTPTWLDGESTGARPGRILRPTLQSSP